MTSTLDPPTGGDVVLVPPVAGLDPSDLRHVPLALLAAAVRAGGLSGGLRPSGGGAAVPVDATRDRTFRELVAQVAAGGDGEDDPAWTPVEYHVGQTPHAGTAPVRLTVTAGTSGLHCAVRCDEVRKGTGWAARLRTAMAAAAAVVAGSPDRAVADVCAAARVAGPAGPDAPAPAPPAVTGPVDTERRRPHALGPPAAPRTPLKRELVDIWRGVLDIDQLGVEDDFFEVGGHSLLAAALVRAMQQRLGADLPVDVLYLRRDVRPPVRSGCAAHQRRRRDG